MTKLQAAEIKKALAETIDELRKDYAFDPDPVVMYESRKNRVFVSAGFISRTEEHPYEAYISWKKFASCLCDVDPEEMIPLAEKLEGLAKRLRNRRASYGDEL